MSITDQDFYHIKISNFVMKNNFVKQFFVLINPV